MRVAAAIKIKLNFTTNNSHEARKKLFTFFFARIYRSLTVKRFKFTPIHQPVRAWKFPFFRKRDVAHRPSFRDVKTSFGETQRFGHIFLWFKFIIKKFDNTSRGWLFKINFLCKSHLHTKAESLICCYEKWNGPHERERECELRLLRKQKREDKIGRQVKSTQFIISVEHFFAFYDWNISPDASDAHWHVAEKFIYFHIAFAPLPTSPHLDLLFFFDLFGFF